MKLHRDLVMAAISDDDLVTMAQVALARAIAGDGEARRWVSSYALGNPEKRIDITIREEAQKLAEQYGLDAEELIREAERIAAGAGDAGPR